MLIAQIVMVATLILMISGKTPLYMTAIVGSTIAAVAAGFPSGGSDAITIAKLINSGLNPVIADMAGVLMFIGIMQACGFMDIIIRGIIKLGRILGGGAGIAVAGGVTAGIIGMLTGFTQPAITSVITGEASTKLNVDPDQSAGIHAHAGHLGNFGGFTHPTQVSVIAMTGVGYGLINIFGIFVSLCIFACSFFRVKVSERKSGFKLTKDEVMKILQNYENSKNSTSFWIAIAPFIVLFGGFVFGYPVFLVGIFSSIIAIILSRYSIYKAEKHMLDGVGKIATPLIATIGFLFMSGVIKNIGLASFIGEVFMPLLSNFPLQSMLIVSCLGGLITQSNSAGAAITLPFLTAALTLPDANHLGLAVMAAGGGAVMQYFLTGGPVAALATVIPVIKGSELKAANKFQRPSILFGAFVLFILSFLL